MTYITNASFHRSIFIVIWILIALTTWTTIVGLFQPLIMKSVVCWNQASTKQSSCIPCVVSHKLGASFLLLWHMSMLRLLAAPITSRVVQTHCVCFGFAEATEFEVSNVAYSWYTGILFALYISSVCVCIFCAIYYFEVGHITGYSLCKSGSIPCKKQTQPTWDASTWISSRIGSINWDNNPVLSLGTQEITSR